MSTGGFWEKSYIEVQCVIPYNKAKYSTILKIDLNLDIKRGQ